MEKVASRLRTEEDNLPPVPRRTWRHFCGRSWLALLPRSPQKCLMGMQAPLRPPALPRGARLAGGGWRRESLRRGRVARLLRALALLGWRVSARSARVALLVEQALLLAGAIARLPERDTGVGPRLRCLFRETMTSRSTPPTPFLWSRRSRPSGRSRLLQPLCLPQTLQLPALLETAHLSLALQARLRCQWPPRCGILLCLWKRALLPLPLG